MEPICLPDMRVNDQGQAIKPSNLRVMRLSDDGKVVTGPSHDWRTLGRS
jgi:hypothetical protein